MQANREAEANLSYVGCSRKARRRAKAMEKAAMRGVTKKESPEQAREAAQKKEAVYKEKIAAWKVSNQVRADVKKAHAKPVGVGATRRAAEVEAALGKEAIVEPPLSKKDLQEDTFEQKVEAWIAFCDRSKADGKEAKKRAADEKVLSDCFSALRDEKIVEPLTASMLTAVTPEE